MWDVTLKIMSECRTGVAFQYVVSDSHDVTTRLDPNSNARLHRVAGISCQLATELKLLVTGARQTSHEDSRLA